MVRVRPRRARRLGSLPCANAIFNFTGTLWNLTVAWSAARFSSGFDRTRLAVWLNRCIGGVFVYLGIRIAFAKQA